MRTLLKNGTLVNVFTGQLERADVLIQGDRVVGVGDYAHAQVDRVLDAEGKYICPGFLDGHIHIESTMLCPSEFARAVASHGTTGVVCDPHEIANVCGTAGLDYMLQASEGLPVTVYVALPSCVPATRFDEAGAVLDAEALDPYYAHPRVLGLGEMMNYPGVLAGDEAVLEKLRRARAHGAVINGHAPLLSGKELDGYLAQGIGDDHECSGLEEAQERIRKGQRVMIRQGTAARNLEALLPLFDQPWCHRCLLVTDDKHPADLMEHGHIDHMIRMAARAGKDPITGIRMATLWAAEYFGLRDVGAVAPGYRADVLVLDELEQVSVRHVFHAGLQTVEDGRVLDFEPPAVGREILDTVRGSFHLPQLSARDFQIPEQGEKECRAIRLIPGQLLTEEWIAPVNFDRDNGIDLERDILKLAVVERHANTGHKGIALLAGAGLKCGAIAASVSHDSHNLIIIGTNEADMAAAGNEIRAMGGGSVVVQDGQVLCRMPLPIAGLMTDQPAQVIARQNRQLRQSVHALGVPEDVEPFMTMAFVSLTVIPHLKLTTLGLVDVDRQELVDLVTTK